MSAAADDDAGPAAADAPRVSVVIAARDMEDFIAETLASALSQEGVALEAIVVDDGSTDATAAIAAAVAARDPRLRIAPGPQRGVSAARNRGFAVARGERVLFLDADDLLTPGTLAALDAALDAAPGSVAALGHVRRIAEDGAFLDPPGPRFRLPEADAAAALLAKNFVVNGGALLIDAAALRRAGGFDEGLRYGEDWELWCRLALLGPFAMSQDVVALLYRQRARGANYRARDGDLALRVAAIDRIADSPDFARRFGARLPRLLRQRRIDVFWAGVRSEFELGSRLRALRLAAIGAAIYPDSLLRPQLAVRFLRSLARGRAPKAAS